MKNYRVFGSVFLMETLLYKNLKMLKLSAFMGEVNCEVVEDNFPEDSLRFGKNVYIDFGKRERNYKNYLFVTGKKEHMIPILDLDLTLRDINEKIKGASGNPCLENDIQTLNKLYSDRMRHLRRLNGSIIQKLNGTTIRCGDDIRSVLRREVSENRKAYDLTSELASRSYQPSSDQIMLEKIKDFFELGGISDSRREDVKYCSNQTICWNVLGKMTYDMSKIIKEEASYLEGPGGRSTFAVGLWSLSDFYKRLSSHATNEGTRMKRRLNSLVKIYEPFTRIDDPNPDRWALEILNGAYGKDAS